MTDVDYPSLLKEGMTGGVSYIAQRYSKSNCKYIT